LWKHLGGTASRDSPAAYRIGHSEHAGDPAGEDPRRRSTPVINSIKIKIITRLGLEDYRERVRNEFPAIR
jgi:hypothetical protein